MKRPGPGVVVGKAVDKAEVLMRQGIWARAKIWSKLRAYLVRLHNRYLHFIQLTGSYKSSLTVDILS